MDVSTGTPVAAPDSFQILQYIIKLARALHRKSKNLKSVCCSSTDESFPGKELTTCSLITPGRDTVLAIPEVIGS